MAKKSEPGQADDRSSKTASGNPSRVIIGANVIVATVLVAGLVVAANFIAWWATGEFNLSKDMTAEGIHSFSSRTRLVLDKLDLPVLVTSLYFAGEKDEEARLEKRRVEDLLGLYESRGDDVELNLIDPVEDFPDLTELGKRITKRHTAETKPYVEAINSYLALAKDLAAFLESEEVLFREAGKNPEVTGNLKMLMDRIPEALAGHRQVAEETTASIKSSLGGQLGLPESELPAQQDEGRWQDMGIPQFSGATSQIGGLTNGAAQLFSEIAQVINQQMQVQGAKLPEAVRQVSSGMENRYKDMQKRLLEMSETLDKLEPLNLDEIRNSIRRNTIIIEMGKKVNVIAYDDIWPLAPGQSRMDPAAERRFGGEDAITSCLVRMSARSKTAAIFVRHGGMPVGENMGQFTELALRLKQNNFQIANWDLSIEQQPPEVQGTDKSVLVVMIPEPPDPRMGMMQRPPSPVAYEPVRKHLAAGGRAMIFARVQVNPGDPRDPGMPYLGILKDFGLDVQPGIAAVTSFANEERDVAVPLLDTTNYPSETNRETSHPVIEPLQGIKARFIAPVRIVVAHPAPEGVQVWSLVEVPDDEMHWGESDMMLVANKNEGTFDPGNDVEPPFPVAVAVVRTPGAAQSEKGEGDNGSGEASGEAASKVIVFGDYMFATDRLIQAHVQLTRAGLALLDFPGNGELLVNSMLWLSDQEDMIAVSPKAMEYGRIGDLGGGKGTFTRWLLWAGLPAAVVLIGIVVYAVRVRVR